MNLNVDEYLTKANYWQEEMQQLRKIVLSCGLTEEFKWKQPCYTYNNSNVVIISEFKAFCVLSFLKGALINDTYNILTKAGENTQSARIIKFTTVAKVIELKSIIKTYITNAIEIEKTGLKVASKKPSELDLPIELENILADNTTFKTAFENLTLGRQKAYIYYFSAPKQSKTRITRIENYMQRILCGKGLNDCICGLSKKLPACDGSHKYITKK